jgi:hypothetical protein
VCALLLSRRIAQQQKQRQKEKSEKDAMAVGMTAGEYRAVSGFTN